jgi:hypothetical protein
VYNQLIHQAAFFFYCFTRTSLAAGLGWSSLLEKGKTANAMPTIANDANDLSPDFQSNPGFGSVNSIVIHTFEARSIKLGWD